MTLGSSRARSTTRHPAPRMCGGPAFTLVEIVIVLLVAGLLMAMAMPRVDVEHYRADAAVQALRAMLQQARRTSLLRQYDVYVVFDTAAREITIAEDANDDGVIQPSEHVHRQPLPEGAVFFVPPTGIDSVVASALEGSSLRPISGLPSIVFHRDGAASTDLDLYIATPPHPRRDYRAVRLFRPTGRTEWYRFDGKRWQRGGL